MSTPNQRNWRGILIALLVIVAVLGLIICSILLLSPPDEGPRVKGMHFTLDNVAGSRFVPKLFNGTWISDVELVYLDNYGGVKVLCVENFTTRSLMTNVTFVSNLDIHTVYRYFCSIFFLYNTYISTCLETNKRCGFQSFRRSQFRPADDRRGKNMETFFQSEILRLRGGNAVSIILD